MNSILEKAKKRYSFALSARARLDKMYSQDDYKPTRMSIDDLVFERQKYHTEIQLLEDIFGKDKLKSISQ